MIISNIEETKIMKNIVTNEYRIMYREIGGEWKQYLATIRYANRFMVDQDFIALNKQIESVRVNANENWRDVNGYND